MGLGWRDGFDKGINKPLERSESVREDMSSGRSDCLGGRGSLGLMGEREFGSK
jgi:hypothetical protein